MKQSRIALVVALVLLAAVLVAVALVVLDPIRQYVGVDGTITIRGHVDQTLLDYILHGPRPSRIEIYELVGDGRPTAHFVPHVVYDYLPPIPGSSGSISGRLGSIQGFLSDAVRIIGGVVLDTIRTGIVSVFDFFTGDASAACTGGNCFWIAGAGNFSSTAHWATSSGGATMTNSSVTIAGSSNTWNVGGGWADANGHFSRGTSTVAITANGNISGVGSTSTSEFYNLTIN